MSKYDHLDYNDSLNYFWRVDQPPPGYLPIGGGEFLFQDAPALAGSPTVRLGTRTGLFVAHQDGYVSIKVTVVASDGEMREFPGKMEPPFIVQITTPRVIQLDMLGPNLIFRDEGPDSTVMPYPEDAAWLDLNGDGDAEDSMEHRFPISSFIGAGLRISQAIIVAPDLPRRDLLVRGDGPQNGAGEAMHFYGKGDAILGQSMLMVSGLRPAQGMLPSTISGDPVAFSQRTQAYSPYDISRFILFDQQNASPCGRTDNRVYVSLASDPNGGTYETVRDLSCRAADGIGGPNAPDSYSQLVVDAIWGQFPDLMVGRKAVDGYNVLDGLVMYYWDPNLPYVSDPQGAGTGCPLTLSGMMRTGVGTCGAWSAFFQAALLTQGIQSTPVRIDPPSDVFPVLLAKPWVFNPGGLVVLSGGNRVPDTSPGNDIELEPMPAGYGQLLPAVNFPVIAAVDGEFVGPVGGDDELIDPVLVGPGTGFWPYVLHTQVCNVIGNPAQGINNVEPPAWFINHGIVKFLGVYYDPSYGTRASLLEGHKAATWDGVANATSGPLLFALSSTNVAQYETSNILYTE